MREKIKIENVEHYLKSGCGRCILFNTPKCKVNRWQKELLLIRKIILKSEVEEQIKWGVPCYTFENKNIILVTAFKDYCAISFFKGSLLKDEKNLLVSPGENSQAAKYFRFQNSKEIESNSKHILNYIKEAVDIEKEGKTINFKSISEYAIPEELKKEFKDNPELEEAFHKLTPGRKRGYLIYFSQPKQSSTKETRIKKYAHLILQGKGMQDH